MKAKDFLGNELKEGDKVAFVQLGYRSLLTGTVKRIMLKTLLISHEATNVFSKETKQFHNQVIKI